MRRIDPDPTKKNQEGQDPPASKPTMDGEVNELTLKVLEVISKGPSFETRRRALNKARRLLGRE